MWSSSERVGTAFFKSVSGLQSESEVVDYQEGGVNNGVRKVPGRTKYPNIVLKRGFTGDKALWNWRQSIVDGKLDLRTGSLAQLGQQGEVVAKWTFTNGWPVKWTGPEFDASKNEIAIETIEIAHEGWTLE